MNILFVWPRFPDLIFDASDPDKSFFRLFSKFISMRKPTTFAILAALTPRQHSIELVEGGPRDIHFERKYDLVGITCTTAFAKLAYEIADEFRRRGTTVVLGGCHPSILPGEAKQHADSVVIGEAEETWPQLLEDLEGGRLKPFYEQIRPVDPTVIPHPRQIYSKGAGIGIQATRGCPFGCEFCSIPHSKFGRIYRMRPIEDVVKEIRQSHSKLFIFQDNSLTINLTYTKQLFKQIKDTDKKFFAYGNIGLLGKDDDLLRIASEAGCIGWFIGFESVCQESLDSIGKRSNKVNEYLSSVKKIHEYGMIIEASFVFGFDFDTPDIFIKTDDFVRKSDLDIPFALPLIPYPGTPIFKKLEGEQRILTTDWVKYDGEHCVFTPKSMTPDELLTNVYNLNTTWHKNSRSITRTIRSLHFGLYPFVETAAIEIYWKLLKWKTKMSADEAVIISRQ